MPKIPSYKIMDLAKAVCNKCKIELIGRRNGEKLHEEMISFEESLNTVELKKYFIILQNENLKLKNFYIKKFKAKKNNKQFTYSSDKNSEFLKIAELKSLINNDIKRNF